MSEEQKLVREFPVEITESGDGRTLDVRIVPYNRPTQVADKPSNGGTGEPYMEEWLPGVFDSQTNASHRVDVLVNFEHERGISGIVGRGQQLWSSNDGAYGSFRMLRTQNADTALELVNEGVATGISLEAIPIKSVSEDGVVKRVKARLINIALCRTGAFEEAMVMAVREEPQESVTIITDPVVGTAREFEDTVRQALLDVKKPEPSEAALALERVGFEPLTVPAAVRKPWDASPARFTDEEYERSCLVHRAGDTSSKERCSLPVLEPDGSLNVNALGPAARTLAGASGGLRGVSLTDKAEAARKLLRYYRKAEVDPPTSMLTLAGN